MKEPIDNEPSARIRGGTTRASRYVDRAELPALAARERVMRLLRAHDPSSRDLAMASVLPSDQAIVRVIAREGAAANAEPTVRYNAIAALAVPSAADNLNLLLDLAHFGEDFYVRGHALLALGSAGMQMALPAIAAHLSASEAFERSAARKAISLIAKKTSIDSVKAHAGLLDGKSRSAIERILHELGQVRERGEVRTTPRRASQPASFGTRARGKKPRR